jgi:hypothetical protein
MFKPASDKPHSVAPAPTRDLEALAALHAEARRRAVQLRREAVDAAWRATGQALRRSAVVLLDCARQWGASAQGWLSTRDPTPDPTPDPTRTPTRCPHHTP